MKNKDQLTDAEIDEIVVREVDDDAAWELPIDVHVKLPLRIDLPDSLASKAAFFARLHNVPSVEEWLQRIIRERLAFEEAAFADIKRVMEKRASYQTDLKGK